MPNKFISGIETIGKDVEKAVEYPFINTAKFIAVVATALKDQPELKTALTGLVKQAEIVIADAGADVASKGLDLTSDTKTITDVQAFFSYFKSSFIPVVESVYSELIADTK